MMMMMMVVVVLMMRLLMVVINRYLVKTLPFVDKDRVAFQGWVSHVIDDRQISRRFNERLSIDWRRSVTFTCAKY